MEEVNLVMIQVIFILVLYSFKIDVILKRKMLWVLI